MKNATDSNNFEDFFAENGSETIATISGMIAAQQNTAINLTKLILEHTIENKISKEEVFEIYAEACDFLKEQNSDFI